MPVGPRSLTVSDQQLERPDSMTGRHLLRTLGIALGCETAAILSPAIAHAAPGDVTITPSVSGNSVTVTVTNRSAAVIGCKMFRATGRVGGEQRLTTAVRVRQSG